MTVLEFLSDRRGAVCVCPAADGIFTADAAVIALGARVLRIEAFAEPMFGASIVASGSMQGAGDSTGCFILNLVSMWGVRLTLAVLLAPRFGLVGVWVACAPSFAPAAYCFCCAWRVANGWIRARWRKVSYKFREPESPQTFRACSISKYYSADDSQSTAEAI